MKINKKIKVLDFKLSKILNGGLFGAYKSKFSGNGMEFSEHKEYHFGDHVKNIDWKASSKTEEMYVKKYEEERDLNVLFLIDNTESMSFGSNDITKKDLLIDIFYSLSLSAYYNNDNIGAIIFDENNLEFLDYKKNKNNIYRILEKIEMNTGYPQEIYLQKNGRDSNGEYPIEKALDEIKSRRIKNNLIFILTDKQKFDLNKLKFLSKDNDIVIINIFDYFENNLSELLGDFVLNEGGKFNNIDVSGKKMEEYKKYRKNKILSFRNIIEKNKLGYIKIDTKSDILKELMGYFSKVNN